MSMEILNKRLADYLKAEETILNGGQSYRIGNRTLTRADLSQIRAEIMNLVSQGATVDGKDAGTKRAKHVIFRD